MPLTNEDLNKIRNVIKAENEMVIIRIEKIESKLSSLVIDNQHFHKEFIRINEKLDQLKKMENEDTKAFYDYLIKLEKRVAKLEVEIA